MHNDYEESNSVETAKSYFFVNGKMYEFPKDKEIFEKSFCEKTETEKCACAQRNPVYPNLSYPLKSTKQEIADRFQKEGMNKKQAELTADDIWKDILPDMNQNIDEWVEGKPMSEIMYGPSEITFNYLHDLWKKNTGIDFSMDFFIPKMKRYIQTGVSDGLYPVIR